MDRAVSAPEQHTESKSSVAISRTAKGDAQPSVKVYEDTTEEELDRIRGLAVSAYQALVRELGGVS